MSFICDKAKRYMTVILIISMLFVSVCNTNVYAYENTENNAVKIDDGYKITTENNNLALYVNGSNGYFAILNKKNNSLWYSVPEDYKEDKISKGLVKTDVRSHFILEYIATEDINTNNSSQKTNSQVACVGLGGIKTENIKNGIRVIYDFKELEIIIPVNYILHDDYFEASIDIDGIDEGNKNRIIQARFLPYFGAVSQNYDGYLFVPDGCGAVAGFNRNIDSYKDYSKMVYGDDSAIVSDSLSTKEETIKVPVFGTVINNKGAMMGVISEGEGSASIFAKTGSAKTNYNSISSLLTYRIYGRSNGLYASKGNGDKVISTVTNTPYGLKSYTVRYYFLDGNNASYIGMAKKYREYLIEEKGLSKKVNKSALSLNVYGSLETTANFLGIKYDKKRLLTSFNDTEEIIRDLKKNGVENIAIQYIGWNNNGIYNGSYPTEARPLSILGGKKDFRDLLSYLNKNKLEYYFAVDFINYSKGSFAVSAKKDAAHTTNGDVAKQYEYSVVTNELNRDVNSWVLLSPSKLLNKSKKFLRNMEKYDINSIGLSSIGNIIYSDFDDTDGVYRSLSVNYFEKFLSSVKNKKIAVEGGNSYVIPYVSRIYELPISSSGFDIFDYDVPFIQIALHGYVNYTTPAVVQSIDPHSTFLKSLEYGSDLLYECVSDDSYNLRETRLSNLFSSKYSLWKEQAIEYYKEQQKMFASIWNKEIVNHCSAGENVFKTEYSGGSTIYVNYSNTEQTIDGVTIGANDYKFIESNKEGA